MSAEWTTGVRVPAGPETWLFATASRPALGTIQTPIQWIPEALSPGNKAVGTRN